MGAIAFLIPFIREIGGLDGFLERIFRGAAFRRIGFPAAGKRDQHRDRAAVIFVFCAVFARQIAFLEPDRDQYVDGRRDGE